MKNSKVLSLSILCLLLIFMMVFVISSDSLSLYASVDNLGIATSNKRRSNSVVDDDSIIDLSNIAYGITDVIDNSSISKIAVEADRFEVFEGMTIEELGAKLNRSLKGVLAGKGEMIAKKCLSMGIDPYMAVAIMLHETGCNGTCSYLSRVKHNVGGMKGASGNFQSFASIDEGIDGFLNNLYGNYYAYGLTTPETINPKYAGSDSWASKVRWYMAMIREN